MAVRVVPFGLLHYHNGEFANFEARVFAEKNIENNVESHVKDSTGSCSLHQLLDLINNGYFLGTDLQVPKVNDYKEHFNAYTENKHEVISIDVLNKGSPVLA